MKNTRQKGNYNGHVLYQPSGRAAEYAGLACNYFVGCSGGCTYCYLQRGVMAQIWSDVPRLKKSFADEDAAFARFEKELKKVKDVAKEKGIFLSFTSDPWLPETKGLTRRTVARCLEDGIRVQILTKQASIAKELQIPEDRRGLVSVGFTLTGKDDFEKGGSPNADRLKALKAIHAEGHPTFVSFEPVYDFQYVLDTVTDLEESRSCELYRIGLLSGSMLYAYYNSLEPQTPLAARLITCFKGGSYGKLYLKESFLKWMGMERADLTEATFVPCHYIPERS